MAWFMDVSASRRRALEIVCTLCNSVDKGRVCVCRLPAHCVIATETGVFTLCLAFR